MGLSDVALPDALAFAGKSKKIEIICEGQEINLYSDLIIKQELNDTSSFSFVWRRDIMKDAGETTTNSSFFVKHAEFQNKHIGKEIRINTLSTDGLVYIGVICSIQCYNPFKRNAEYKIQGKGLMCKLTDVKMCRSWQKKSLDSIISDLKSAAGLSNNTFESNITHSGNIAYTVQYNQSVFDFMASLAIKYGQWFYYNGEKIIFGKPEIYKEITLHSPDSHLFDLCFETNAMVYQEYGKGFDLEKTEAIDPVQFLPTEPSEVTDTLLYASYIGGKRIADNIINSAKNVSFLNGACTPESIKKNLEKKFKTMQSASALLKGETNIPSIGIGKLIKIEDESGGGIGEFIVTEIIHESSHYGHYLNKFKAVPKGNMIPPIRNAPAKIITPTQIALVEANDDSSEDAQDKGKSKIKVKFPWQIDNETSPWIDLMGLHGGQDKGVHFLPEVGDAVMVDFVEGNVEQPYVIGTVYTGNQQSKVATKKNNLKSIATREGLRILFDDENKGIWIADNFIEEYPKNQFNTIREKLINLESAIDNDNLTQIVLNNKENIEIKIINDTEEITTIKLDGGGEKITIQSKGNIDITADKTLSLKGNKINLEANEINLEAQDSLTAAAKSKVSIEANSAMEIAGMEVKVEGKASTAISGVNTKITGDVMLALKSSGVAEIQGSLVKIN